MIGVILFRVRSADVKKVVKARNELLFDYFLSGKTRPANEWLAVYPTNTVLRKVAELIVWNQGKDTFQLTKDGAVDCNGQPYTINENRSIGVAHPIEMDDQTAYPQRRPHDRHSPRQLHTSADTQLH